MYVTSILETTDVFKTRQKAAKGGVPRKRPNAPSGFRDVFDRRGKLSRRCKIDQATKVLSKSITLVSEPPVVFNISEYGPQSDQWSPGQED